MNGDLLLLLAMWGACAALNCIAIMEVAKFPGDIPVSARRRIAGLSVIANALAVAVGYVAARMGVLL